MGNKGFSLVELLVVVAIIGVLAGVGVVGYDRYVENTRVKVLYQNMEQLTKAIDFEKVVAENNLTSVLKEVDESGNMVKRDADGTLSTTTNASEQTKINSFTNCNNFSHSLKKHFEEFENPWKAGQPSITIDTDGQAWHRQGQIQLVCYKNSGGFGEGAGCPIAKSRLLVIGYAKDRGRWNVAAGNCGLDCVKVWNSGGTFFSNRAQAKADCEWSDTSASTDAVWGDWDINTVQTNSAAGGRCSNGSTGGTPCD